MQALKPLVWQIDPTEAWVFMVVIAEYEDF